MTNTSQLSRRGFGRILGAGAAYVALQPSLGFSLPGIRAIDEPKKAPGIVRLSANENPYGPSPAALKAMTDNFGLAWRYPDEYEDKLAAALATLNSVSRDQVMLGNGSGEILRVAAMAFTGSTRKIVVADPTFEAIARHARTYGAEVHKVRLTESHSHDLAKMLEAAGGAGLIYICNPNNPTASITPKAAMRTFLDKVPQTTMVLVDEAYHHYVESSDYESAMSLVRDYPNLIVARTFSKIYGMAGLRCGYCVTGADNLRQMRAHQVWDSVNIMAIVAALASLADDDHVQSGRRNNREVKRYVCTELDKQKFGYIPSEANFMMIDLRRDVLPVISSLRNRGVEVGRFFSSLPQFMRVTIGTKPQMETFVSAFREVMAQLS